MDKQTKNTVENFDSQYRTKGLHAQRLYPNEQLIQFIASNYFAIPHLERRRVRVLEVGCGSGQATGLFVEFALAKVVEGRFGKGGVVFVGTVGAEYIKQGHPVGPNDMQGFPGHNAVPVEAGDAEIEVGTFGRLDVFIVFGVQAVGDFQIETADAVFGLRRTGWKVGFDPADAFFKAVLPVIGFIALRGGFQAAGKKAVEVDILVGMQANHIPGGQGHWQANQGNPCSAKPGGL